MPQDIYKNWRKLPFGDMLDLYMLDVRLYDRDRFAADQNDTLFGHPDAKILGPEQLTWINTELANSTARWKVLGNQLQMTQFQIGNVPLVFENWDGYPVERLKFFNNLINNQVDNMVVVTGDFHVSFANDVAVNPFNLQDYNPFTGAGAIGVEFIIPSLTGDNFDEGNDFGLGSAALASGLIQAGNWHTKYVELEGHGYVLLDLDSARAQAEFWHMDDISDPTNFNENLVATWLAMDGDNHLSQGSGASDPNTNVAPPPPTVVVSLENPISEATVLSLYPNPAELYTYLNYVLTHPGMTTVQLTDLNGRKIRKVMQQKQSPGNYLLEIDLKGLASGIYLLEIVTPGGKATRKLVKQ
jgi:alkaline phosphatase D